MKHLSSIIFALALGVGLVAALFWLLHPTGMISRAAVAQEGAAAAGVRTVCPAGPPMCDYDSIQEAVDAANEGQTIKVAAGTYSDLHTRPSPPGYLGPAVISQMVYISKSVTIRGGYTTAFSEPFDPDGNPTTLDAQGQGRVLFITGDISPTISGLRLTGGDADGLAGGIYSAIDDHAGGGVYIITATATLSNNQVHSNTTSSSGGGLYLFKSASTLRGNRVFSNTADVGGGLFLYSSDATLSDNTISANSAASGGGGLLLFDSHATVSHNTISANKALDGGGLALLYGDDAIVSHNTISANSATSDAGGLQLYYSDATLSHNTISANSANGDGGGLGLIYSQATVSYNTIRANSAYNGGGLELFDSDDTLSGNTIIANRANSRGGGLFLLRSDPTLINNVVADNQAGMSGSGLYISSSSPRLLHTSIARNSGGNGSGIYLSEFSTANTIMLTNTILAGHAVALFVPEHNTVTLQATLWGSGAWANGTDWEAAGTILTSQDIWGEPAFVNPDAGDYHGDYHITAESAAVDAGVNAGVEVDFDGQPRPIAAGVDIGADEWSGPNTCAATIYSVGSGAWNNPTTWYPSRVPTSNDIVLIQANHTISGSTRIQIQALCNEGTLHSQANQPLQILANGPLTNTGTITGSHGLSAVKEENVEGIGSNCGTPGSTLDLRGRPIYNAGLIKAGNGGDGEECGGDGGNVMIFGRNLTNTQRGAIQGGHGGNVIGTSSTSGRAGQGGQTHLRGNWNGSGDLDNDGLVRAGDGGSSTTNSSPGHGGCLTIISQPNLFLDGGQHHGGQGGQSSDGSKGQDGCVIIEPNTIQLSGPKTRIRGGDITIFGGHDWELDLSQLSRGAISATGSITLAVGNGGNVDLTDNNTTVLQADGAVLIASDNVELDPGTILSDVISATKIASDSKQILFDFSLSGPRQASGQPGVALPLPLTLLNNGPMTDSYHLKWVAPAGWTIELSSSLPITIAALEMADLTLLVTPESEADYDQTSTILLSATSQAAPNKTKDHQFDVRIGESKIYLPLLLKNEN